MLRTPFGLQLGWPPGFQLGRRRRDDDAQPLLPSRVSIGLALLTAALLILSFPNFDLAPLAWLALVPLLYAVVFRPSSAFGAFALGWITGSVYLVGTCYWLTYAMIHYGGIPWPVAYLLLVPVGLLVGLFPALFAWALRRVAVRWGALAVWTAPLIWMATEWLRFKLTGQLWNALGYSQAFYPSLIQPARWGGVYAVSGLVVLVNTAVVYWLGYRLRRHAGLALAGFTFWLGRLAKSRQLTGWSAWLVSRSLSRLGIGLTIATALLFGLNLLWGRNVASPHRPAVPADNGADVVVVQPNVPMEPIDSLAELDVLMERHVELSEIELSRVAVSNRPRLVIWPESPMSFLYSRDTALRERLAAFAVRNRTSLLINSMEPAPNDGAYNSAMLIDEHGKLIAQYDKIYLLPFGEYLPIPPWVPGLSLIPPVVGNFSAGARYPLIPVGPAQAGIMICFESAIPALARRYSTDGADALIEMTNDGYLGPTPVQRQHLANAVFRAVENQRPVVRATNTGISAMITTAGVVVGPTGGFEAAARTWPIARTASPPTFYARFGDLLSETGAALTLLLLVLSYAVRPGANASAD